MYYHIYPASKSPCSLSTSTDSMLLDWKCRTCGDPKPTVQHVNIRIAENKPHAKILNFIQGGTIIINKGILRPIPENIISRDLYLGNLIMEDGLVNNEWATLRGRKKLIVRGTNDVACRICEECKQVFYYSSDSRYLYPAPDDNIDIYESDNYGIIVNEYIYNNIHPLLVGVVVKQIQATTVSPDGMEVDFRRHVPLRVPCQNENQSCGTGDLPECGHENATR
jgi:hypothetical protein